MVEATLRKFIALLLPCVAVPLLQALSALAAPIAREPAPIVTQSKAAPSVRPSKPAGVMAWSEIGGTAGAQYKGAGLAIVPTERGAMLRCAFQKLEGEATAEGLWLTSTVPGAEDCFLVVAAALGRVIPRWPGPANKTSSNKHSTLDSVGSVSITGQCVRFTRPGLVEEYSVSLDGVRQDFVITQRPAGCGELRVELEVTGARAEATMHGARLTLTASGRKLAYSRLRATDATGRALECHIEVASVHRIAVLVNDSEALYPVRIDPTFSDENWISMGALPGANGEVRAAVVDSAGNLYIGGSFTIVGNVFATNIARWNGSSWSALGSGLNGDPQAMSATVLALAISGNEVYAGGLFASAGGNEAKSIAKWNGNSWSALGLGMGGGAFGFPVVRSLRLSGSELYVGGDFSITAPGGIAATNVAKWNGSTWSALGSGLNSWVYALELSGSDLYAAGGFSGGVSKWNGSTWSTVGSGLNDYVFALAVSGSNVYAGGLFQAGNYIAKWDGSSWTGLGSGMDDIVATLAVAGNDLYVGGMFTMAGDTAATNIAKWNGSSWSPVGSGISAPQSYGYYGGRVYALAVSGSNVYAGGIFTTAGGNAAQSVARWDASSWSALGIGMNHHVNAVAVSANEVYAGGSFTKAGGSPADYIAKWNGSSWSALGSDLNGPVNALAVSGSDL